MKPTLSIDKSIYIQIAEKIENDILNNNLAENEQVPSTNQFSQIFQINPATAAKGINILVDEGILYKKRGIGMFVSEGAKEMILKKRQKIFFDQTIPEIILESERLEITREELLESIRNYNGGKDR
ncbi:GntR family transcriptional regulator [Brassicibacter mesophilus]|uniref:GntR family transcriptional regulator n=1 Tax=Brassicibacter mesophilus TaxID=745119 RepID=UPI003D1A4398